MSGAGIRTPATTDCDRALRKCLRRPRARDAYAKLEFPGTYHLAFRDLPDILRTHVAGRTALDFGCGTGLSAFTFDNIPSLDIKLRTLTALGALLQPTGRLVNLVSSPAIYLHEWVSFSTRRFPENRSAASGDRVRIVMLDVPDRRPVEDVVCSDTDYRRLYAQAGLAVHALHQPLGRAEDGIAWVSETTVAPWSIYVLGPSP